MLSEIDGKHEMYGPHMPVAGVEEYFDREFYNRHYSEILKAYNNLYDEKSRAIFSSVINYKHIYCLITISLQRKAVRMRSVSL